MRILGLFALLSKSTEATVFEIDGDQSEFDILQHFYQETGEDLSLSANEITGQKQTRFGLGQAGNLSARRQALIRRVFLYFIVLKLNAISVLRVFFD